MAKPACIIGKPYNEFHGGSNTLMAGKVVRVQRLRKLLESQTRSNVDLRAPDSVSELDWTVHGCVNLVLNPCHKFSNSHPLRFASDKTNPRDEAPSEKGSERPLRGRISS